MLMTDPPCVHAGGTTHGPTGPRSATGRHRAVRESRSSQGTPALQPEWPMHTRDRAPAGSRGDGRAGASAGVGPARREAVQTGSAVGPNNAD